MYTSKVVSREEFDKAVEALWTEIEYQNTLNRRTKDEAKDPPGFFTLGRRYLRKAEDEWSDNAGVSPECLHALRKLSAIFLRSMIYCGIRQR